MDLHEVYTVWDKPSSVHPRCAPLAWSVAPPASVPVYCPLFSNLTLVIFVWLIILSGPYLPAWKPESLASLEQPLIKHWSEPYQLLKMAGFTIFKQKVLVTKAQNAPLPTSWPPDVEHPCLWQPSLHHGAVLSPGSDQRTVPLSSQHTLCESSLTPCTLETPSKPQASRCLFCSRPYAEHRRKKWKKTQPLISWHPVSCTSFQKQPLRAALAKMSDGRWDVTSEVHRRFGGQAEFKQRNLPLCGRV